MKIIKLSVIIYTEESFILSIHKLNLAFFEQSVNLVCKFANSMCY